MQTDLQTILMITGAVCGVYIVFSLMRRKRKEAFFPSDQDLETMENEDATMTKKHSDPLMDVSEELVFEKKTVVTKKIIIDDAAEPLVVHAEHMDNLEDLREVEDARSVESPSMEPSFVALTVMAKPDQPFSGELLFSALTTHHFYYGKDHSFDRHTNDNPMQSTLYSVLSIVEPGVFDIDEMPHQAFPGILLLMTLSTRMSPLVVFEKMLNSARQLAVSLNGELCDAHRKPLTAPMMSQIRETIQKNHRRSLTQSASGASVF